MFAKAGEILCHLHVTDAIHGSSPQAGLVERSANGGEGAGGEGAREADDTIAAGRGGGEVKGDEAAVEPGPSQPKVVGAGARRRRPHIAAHRHAGCGVVLGRTGAVVQCKGGGELRHGTTLQRDVDHWRVQGKQGLLGSRQRDIAGIGGQRNALAGKAVGEDV